MLCTRQAVFFRSGQRFVLLYRRCFLRCVKVPKISPPFFNNNDLSINIKCFFFPARQRPHFFEVEEHGFAFSRRVHCVAKLIPASFTFHNFSLRLVVDLLWGNLNLELWRLWFSAIPICVLFHWLCLCHNGFVHYSLLKTISSEWTCCFIATFHDLMHSLFDWTWFFCRGCLFSASYQSCKCSLIYSTCIDYFMKFVVFREAFA